MKKKILSLMAFACMATAATAQDVSGLHLGYCDGRLASAGTVGSSKKDVWMSGAIGLSPNDMKPYANCHIDTICAGLVSKLNIDSLVVWVRTSLDGDNLAEGSLTKSDIFKGWNRVGLKQPYTVPANLQDSLYIGYSYHQKSSAYGLSIVTPGQPGGFYANIAGEGWQDRSQEGVLSIEALVYGDNLPKLNLALKAISLQDVFVCDKGTLKVSATVRNIATQTVTGFDFTTTVDGIDEPCVAHVDTTLAYDEEKTVEFTVRPAITEATPDKRKVTVTLAKLNEGDDENMDDNTLSDTIAVARHDYTHNVLVEEFTTEDCSNCPRMANILHEILASGKYGDRLNIICHHSGYYTDWLTTVYDTGYLWFFNAGGSTYAPALMVDRMPFGGSTAVICPSTQSEAELYIDYCMAQPAFVSLDITAELDSLNDKMLNVRVKGERSKADITSGNPRIVVTLVENDIAARSQAGGVSSFTHQHVNRSINNAWGEEIEWNGDEYDYSCSLSLRDDYKRENMQIIAYIYGYDKDDATNCSVANSAAINMPSEATGINATKTDRAMNAKKYYDLSGSQVPESQLRPGLYIVKEGGKTVKRMVR